MAFNLAVRFNRAPAGVQVGGAIPCALHLALGLIRGAPRWEFITRPLAAYTAPCAQQKSPISPVADRSPLLRDGAGLKGADVDFSNFPSRIYNNFGDFDSRRLRQFGGALRSQYGGCAANAQRNGAENAPRKLRN